jgi:signal transduction histidine kinase
MKFFSKLYFSMLILLTLALAVAEYSIVSFSLESSVNTQVDMALKQHQQVKYAFQSDFFSVQQVNPKAVDLLTIRRIAGNASDSMNVDLALFDDNERELYSTLLKDPPELDPSEGEIEYRAVPEDNKIILYSESVIKQSGIKYELITSNDITSVYDSARQMQFVCLWVYLAVIIFGAIFAFIFSLFITMPIKALTRAGEAFRDGNFSGRVYVNSKDEIAELAGVYNQMAQTIEEKIEDLELAVKQREDFTAAFAHELKTPMTSIIGYADTLYQKDLTEDEAREAAGFIVNEGMRLEALSFKLLDLMTLNKHDYMLEEIQMADFLKDVEDTVKPAAAKRGVNLFFDYVPGYVRIEFDLFKTLIINLIDNAMKSGTTDVAVLSQVKENTYMVAIVDHGRGIPAAELKRVTEAFYMVDKARSRKEHGAGLGLALCQKIAQIHGTRLDIRSKEGEGTAIRISLKLVEGDADE